MGSYIDLILLVPLGLAAWRGWKNGFVMELISSMSLFVGIYAAVRLSDWMSVFLRERLEVKAENLAIISFIVVLVLVMVVLFFLGKMITRVIKAGGGEFWNKIGGSFFSLVKSLLFLSLFFILFHKLNSRTHILSEAQQEKSILYKPVMNFSLFILPTIKDSQFYQRLNENNPFPVGAGDAESKSNLTNRSS